MKTRIATTITDIHSLREGFHTPDTWKSTAEYPGVQTVIHFAEITSTNC